MKKLFGFTIGGLHHKILRLVLINLLVVILVFGVASVFQKNALTDIVETAKTEQEKAITDVSEESMHQVIESSLTKTNAMQAYIADNYFSEIVDNIKMLRSLAESLFSKRDMLDPAPFAVPDPADDGRAAAHVLYEAGVDYTKSEYLPVAAHMSDTMISLFGSSSKIGGCFIGLADGTHIGVDLSATDKYDENGVQKPFPVRERPWYKGAAETRELYFTDVERDAFNGNIFVTCSAPVIVDGKLFGVVGIDIILDSTEDYISSLSSDVGFVCIINNEGHVIAASENNGLFTPMPSDSAVDMRNSDNKELADFVSLALTEPTGLKTVTNDGREYFMAGTPINTVGWTVISAVDKQITEQPTENMLSEYDRINNEATSAFKDGMTVASFCMILILISMLLIIICGVLHFAGRIVRPIESMTAEIIEGGRTGKLFEMKDIYETNDEIEVLAESFDDLSKKTRQYIIDITRITKEKERIGTELELARKIQADMLPNIYPAFPDRKEFDIYATMTPAKEVGGDFYDFFLVDDDHLGIVMADVSGKGVPAALFMMMSKILINNYTMQGGSPAKVLEQMNSAICKKNDEEMFVTVWLGILEISTGRITASNAGHEFPIIKKANGSYELFRDKHCFVVGGMSGMKYKDYELTLEKGDSLFLYTDGVPEATNSDNVLFGTDRLVEVLNRNKELGPYDLLPKVKDAIDEFVGDANQFDDLTMLSLTLF